MKVVVFCGGLGVRMGEETQRIPKPMIRIGNRPILWHIMRYFAAWGHTEFVLCLGYKGDVIREYFLDFTVDRNPYKHGLFLPGTHIPILHPDALEQHKPDYILILPWNLKAEIVSQMRDVAQWGAKFVVPIPEATVIDPKELS